jgi:sugar phosphate isomerase/epimerase
MHPRISINGVCFREAPLEEDLAAWHALGAHTVGEHVRKLADAGFDAGIAMLQASGLRVESLVQPAAFRLDDPAGWGAAQAGFRRAIDAAARLGAHSVYTTSGHRGVLTWEEAAAGFCAAMAPVREHAAAKGIRVLIEPTVALHAEISIVHTLRDTVRLAEMAGLGVCVDIFHCWTEPDLRETLARAVPLAGLVQVGDYVLGDKSLPCRAVPGDGAIPLARIIGWLLEAGYTGMFDLEQNGPRIDREGTVAAARRGAQRLGEILARVGAA